MRSSGVSVRLTILLSPGARVTRVIVLLQWRRARNAHEYKAAAFRFRNGCQHSSLGNGAWHRLRHGFAECPRRDRYIETARHRTEPSGGGGAGRETRQLRNSKRHYGCQEYDPWLGMESGTFGLDLVSSLQLFSQFGSPKHLCDALRLYAIVAITISLRAPATPWTKIRG